MLRRTLRIGLWSFAALVVAMAVLLSAARLLLPGMSGYRGQIEAVAARIFNRPVSIGSVDAAWHGLSPVLKFRDLIIDDPRLPGGKLAVDQVEVAVNVVESLLQRKLLTAGITVIGTDLELDTDVRHSQEKFSLKVVVDWLLAQDSVMLKGVQLHWRDPGLFDAPVRLGGLSAKLVNTGQRHQFAVEAQLPMSQGGSLKVAADLFGKPGDYAAWRGTLYLRSEDAQLSEFQPAMADSGLQAGGAFNLELWLGLADARAEWGSGSLAWHKPAVRNVSAAGQGVRADKLAARFQWQRHDQRWRIGVSDFQLERDGHSVWPASRFDLVVAQEDKLRIRGKASVLVLEELTAVLPLLPWVDDNALAMLDRLQPRGLMHDAEFSFRYRAGTRPEFAMRSAIENLSLAANGGLPGVTGISGRVEGNLQAGHLQLDTSSAELRIPGVFPGPLALTGLDGDVHWQRYRDRFRIETGRLRVASGPLTLESRWLMDWPYDKGSPWLDLQLAADTLPLPAVSGFLPAGIMSAHAVQWLRQAFREGTASNIRMLLQGRLDQMPFDEGQGRFEARFDFADVNLDYHEGWGPLVELGGQAVFIGRTMQISSQSARLGDAPVERAVATIQDMKRPVLNVDGTVDSTLAAMLDFVRHSPLQEEFGKLIDATETSGDARLQLHLGIPLKHDLGRVRVQGNVLLDGNDLLPRQSDIGLSDIRGRLYFTRSDVSLKNARARVLGQPVALSVYKQGKDADAATVVNVQGRLKLVDRARQQFPALAGWLHGDTGWQALLQVRDHEQAGQPRVSMDLHSGLEGVTISLPAPFAKAAAEARSVTVTWVPGEETVEPVQVRYGDLVKVNLLLTRDHHLRKAALHFGDHMAPLPPRDELQVSGHLDVIDAGEWLPVLKALDSGTTGAAPAPGIDLQTDVFRLGGVEVHNVTAASKPVDPWYFKVNGEGASGWIRWVRMARILPPQLLAKLDRLQLHSRDRDGWSLPGGLQPASLPDLGVEVRDLQWNERDLGQIAIVSRRTDDGVHFETLRLQSPAISLEGTGDWLVRNGVQASQLRADITAGSLERLSRMLGNSGIKGGTLKGRVALSWPGSPADFGLSRMEGEFDVVSRDGRLENVEEGGAGKLLSLLSLNSLQRRLSLDFSDVVKEGLSYDVMKGHFVVMDGDAYTNDFTLEGTSVNIEVSGRTGLVKHDYDQLIKVTPQVTSTLPIAGAIAGGPLVGAAVFLADKLLGDRFNRLTQVQYQVSGSWEKPVYTKLSKEKPRRTPADSGDEY